MLVLNLVRVLRKGGYVDGTYRPASISNTNLGETVRYYAGTLSLVRVLGNSVADPDPNPDPDPPNPRVFGPPGSGSGSASFYHHAKIVRKTLIPTIM
jgi:hypothetical protein